ncbi:hypothetical protein ACSBR2_039370 [Camellia fascicularis]
MHSISFGSLFFAISSKEIARLSQFEHENIVQYYGTDKALILVLLDLPGLLSFSTYTLLVALFWAEIYHQGKKRKDMICIALADYTRDHSKISMNNVVITPFKTQTRIWLGEVLHKRLHDQLTISDVLADGELLEIITEGRRITKLDQADS